MTKQDIIKKAYSFQGANREFSQEMGPIMEGIVNMIGVPALEVDNVESLTATQLDNLKAGDVVIKKSGNEKHTYVVVYKDEVNGELSLVYTDAWNAEEVYYEKGVSGWAFVVKDITALSGRISVTDQRAQLDALCRALEKANVVTSYTISETATDNVFSIEFNE